MIGDPFGLIEPGRLPVNVLEALRANFATPVERSELLVDLLTDHFVARINSEGGSRAKSARAAARGDLYRETAGRLRAERPISLESDAACARAVRAELDAAVQRGEVAAEQVGAVRTIRRSLSGS